ncbi:MAG: hypothetical protein IPM24_05080 [Bryobacterales bacterium]|nr:hypothetical protein [Bryobacterales bacterium]
MRRWLAVAVLGGIWMSGDADAQDRDKPRLQPLPELDANMRTGPAVGERIPAFAIRDHSGRTQTFESIRGPKGALLVFVRSADW